MVYGDLVVYLLGPGYQVDAVEHATAPFVSHEDVQVVPHQGATQVKGYR